jgi:hypothetical protein
VAVEPLYIEFIKAREADILARITTRQLFFPQNWTVGTLSQTQKLNNIFPVLTSGAALHDSLLLNSLKRLKLNCTCC